MPPLCGRTRSFWSTGFGIPSSLRYAEMLHPENIPDE